MQTDWQTATLESCMEAIIDYRGKTPKKTSSGIPLITAKIIKGGAIQPVTEFIAEEDYDSWMRRGIPKPGDVVMTVEAPLGEVAQLDNRKIALAQRVITLRGKTGVLDNTFLKYLLISSGVQHQLDGRATGTTVKGIKQSELRQIELRFPSLEHQKAIANILGSIDDKIELNRQMNETLEAMAQALFKSWFVDFDPVIDNALSAGNEIPEPFQARAAARQALGDQRKPLPANILAQFPSSFVFTDEMGWIPEGWRVGSLGSIVEQRTERAKPSEHTRSVPYVPIDCISQKSLFLQESKGGDEAQSSLTKFYTNDILFGAMRPYFHKVCVAPFEGTTRTTAFVLHPREKDDFAFALMSLNQDKTIEYATAQSTGTTIPYAKWGGSLSEFSIVIPPESIRKLFGQMSKEWILKIPTKFSENKTLVEMREALLPKLLSGEIRVASVEQQIAGVL